MLEKFSASHSVGYKTLIGFITQACTSNKEKENSCYSKVFTYVRVRCVYVNVYLCELLHCSPQCNHSFLQVSSRNNNKTTKEREICYSQQEEETLRIMWGEGPKNLFAISLQWGQKTFWNFETFCLKLNYGKWKKNVNETCKKFMFSHHRF